jgi:hypothetical protein
MTTLIRVARIAAALVLGALVLAACVPTSENPILSKSGGSDPALAGAWAAAKTDEKGPSFMHFLSAPSGEFTVLLISDEAQAKEEADWSVFRVVTAEIKGSHYMSALWDMNSGKPVDDHEKGYHLLRYEIRADGTLQLFMVDEDKLKQAVKDGKIEGRIDGQGESSDVRLTASSEKLEKFLERSKPADLFDKPFVTLHKVPA